MRKFLETEKIDFDPEMIEVMVRAFDEAWKAVEGNGADINRESARNFLARYIVASAIDGQRDPSHIAQHALIHLAQATGAHFSSET